MGGNNSCGTRSIRYGTMRDNVSAIDAILATSEEMHFGCVDRDRVRSSRCTTEMALANDLLSLGDREREEIGRRFPKLMRRVGGYNIDALAPHDSTANLAHLLVGSEGTLAFSTRLELKLSPILRNRVMGVCHFPSFRAAMASAQHIVKLEPTAVELIDRTLIELALDIPLFRATVERFVRGEPEAILLVEFAETDQAENLRRLKQLSELMGDLGFAWNNPEARRGGVVDALEARFQAAITGVRQSGLNIVMSMKTEGKPVSFVEDCAVHLEHLADYTANLTTIFENMAFAAHGMPMPRSVVCTFVQYSISSSMRTSAKCARSRRKLLRLSALMRARIPVSTAMVFCVRSLPKQCSVLGWWRTS
jgi:FAD/FMN-containing dehydrogenase